MPICKREGFENFSENNNSNKRNTFHDNEKVFYCETTKQIFRDYEEYFRHVMVINSTIWQCEVTKRENLTYAEALKSERRALKKREQFKDYLRPIVLLVVEKAQQSSMKTLCSIMYTFLRARFFINEEVEATNKKNGSTFHKYVVTTIEPVSPSKSPPDGSVYDPVKLIYTLRKIDGLKSGTEFKRPYDQIRRSRISFSHENLRMYIEDNVVRVEGILRPKPESYKKYVTDRKVTFEKLFIGKLPYFEPSRPKNQDKKQSSMSKYLTKNGTGEPAPVKTGAMIAAEEAAREERAKNLIKEMERLRKEKEERQAELERKKAERMAKIEEEAVALAKKTDDLERVDQKLLPKYQTIVTNIPDKYFGDALMVNEFMNSFSGVLCGNNVFRNKITFFELTRAFTSREVVGPLSDIILILLGTIFGLQNEEESECAVEYLRVKQHNEQQPFKAMDEAAETHEFVNRHYSAKLNRLPLDAHTISEVLRLHLLASGANVTEKAERYRLTYRNGYYSTEDPGLIFRMQQPHVLRALKMYTIYQLPMIEIFKILNILIAQILSYSSTINLIEERMEATAKAKVELKALVAAERQRAMAVEAERKKVVAEYATQVMEQPAETKQLEEKMNKKVAEILAQGARENKKFKDQLLKLHRNMFDYMVFLGMDRSYRKYYVLESIPGVFVEHSLDSLDVCLEKPPKNLPHLVGCPKGLKDIRAYLTKMYSEEEKKNKRKSLAAGQNEAAAAQENKENKENQAVVTNGEVKLNGDAGKMEVDGEVEPEAVVVPPKPPTQYELLMCTGDPKNCFVHDPKNTDRQRWAYFYKEEDIDAVINGLNSLGERESYLKDNLITMRELIVEHTKNCPVDVLSLEKDKSSQFSRFKLQIKSETKRKYNAANFGFPDDHDLNEVMYAMLVDRVLQFEIDITTGDLGKLKIKDLEKWRNDIQSNTYDPQQELTWGGEQAKKPFKEPGLSLGETLDIDSEDSADEGISLHDSTLLRKCVKNLASALLQIEQGIEQKFMKEPFGIKKDKYDKSVEPLLEKGRERLKEWEISLMHSTSYSQVFLHLNTLHGAIKWQRSTNKSLCAICRRGTDPEKMLLCDECNAGTHMFCMKPKMRTVPEGNWYCNRCVTNLGFSNEKQEPKKKKQKRAFVMDEEDNASVGSSQSNSRRQSRRRQTMEEAEVEEELCNDDEAVAEDEEENGGDENGVDGEEEGEEEQDITMNGTNGESLSMSNAMEEEADSEDEEICAVCSYNGGEISCTGCKSVYHLDCADLRRAPRGSWSCKTCRNDQSKKRKSKQNDDSTEDEDYEQPLVKRVRSSTSSSKRSSVRNSMHDSLNGSTADDSIRQYNNNNNNNRRRRAENLPLNSSLLYDLLDEIMKNENSWPFLRPVTHSEVPDYHTIIKEPMDFAKVKSKLNMGKYTINEELLKDIELVFKNCDIYNQEGNEIYEAGSSLEKFVMQRCKDHNLPFQPSDMNRL